MSGVAKHEKETRSRIVVVAYVFAVSLVDLFEQRQIACRLTDNRINGCFSPSSSSSSSSSFSSSRFRFPARLVLREEVPQAAEEPPLHLRGTFASLFLPCLSVDVPSSFSRHPPWRNHKSGEKRVEPARTVLSVATKRRLGLEGSRRTKRERKKREQ